MTRPKKITGHAFDGVDSCTCDSWYTTATTTRARSEAYREHLAEVWEELRKSTVQEHVLFVARSELGWSQLRLAQELSTEMTYKKSEAYGQETIARWESSDPARRVPSPVIAPLARVLKVSPLALIGGDAKARTVPPAASEHYADVLFWWVRKTGLALKIVGENGCGWELRPRKGKA